MEPRAFLRLLEAAQSKREDVPPTVRELLLSLRQARIIEIGAIEDFLGIERTHTPQRKRRAS